MPLRRILIVDDEENIGRSLRMILEREGYQVNAVRSGAEFRAFPERARIDLFLLDMRLPDASGIDLLRELQAAEITSPAVMISGHATIADAVAETTRRLPELRERVAQLDNRAVFEVPEILAGILQAGAVARPWAPARQADVASASQ